MNYINNHLMPDETVVFQTRLHWMVFIPWVVLSLLILSAFLFVPHTPININIIRVFAIALIFRALVATVYYLTSEFGLTSKRVLGKTGLITIHSLDILLLKVEAVKLEQGVLGRIFNFGDLIVSGTGGTKHTLRRIPEPLRIRNIIQKLANKVHSKNDVKPVEVF